MEGQFSAKSKSGNIYFSSRDEFDGYVRQIGDQDLVITVKPVTAMSEKERMYAYLHGPVYEAVMNALTHDGWEGVDKVVAESYLKNHCARDIMYNKHNDQTMTFWMSKGDMDKKRLLKYIVDCLQLLEERHGVIVMDGNEYRAWKETGQSAFSVKKNKKL